MTPLTSPTLIGSRDPVFTRQANVCIGHHRVSEWARQDLANRSERVSPITQRDGQRVRLITL